MKKRIPLSMVIIGVLALVWLAFPITASFASTYYVATTGNDESGNGTEGSPWKTIQGAIDKGTVSNGDVIIVKDGTYTENVDVDKQLTIQSENGYASTTVVAASSSDHVFYINTNNVTITGFTIYGATGTEKAGICLYNADDCTIENNKCGVDASHTNYIGIYLRYYNDNNAILGNTTDSNTNQGIRLDSHSSNNTIAGNTCEHNNSGILLLVDNDNNTITGNTCSNNDDNGIRLYNSSDNNMISGNTCENNSDGSGNDSGIDIDLDCINNIIVENTFKNSKYGIVIWSATCQNNRFYLNTLSDNTTNNVYVSAGTSNTWCSPTTMYYDYISGSLHKNYLGNYYSDRGGNDDDGDGIGSQDYTTGSANDQYPLWQTSDNYSLQAWWLHSDDKMYRDDMTKAPGSVTISNGGSNIWIADQAALMNINFSGSDTWTGQVAFTSAPAVGHTFTVELGYYDGSFHTGGPMQTITGDGSATVFTFITDASAFSVSTGQYLALKITSNHAEYSVTTGGAWSYASSPESSTDYSLPVELTSFNATAGDGQVTLNWATESEIENLGFNIYRSTKYNDQFSIINDELIPGAGNSSQRHEYEYVDKGLTNGIKYWYKLEDVDYSGNTELHGPVSATPMKKAAPSEFCLYPNYPNPFNPITTISYDLPDDGLVELSVYNMRGEKVTTLMQGDQEAGSYRLNWDGTSQSGEMVSSGIYFLRIASGSYSRTSKMVFIR